jgi:hypothetical protein
MRVKNHLFLIFILLVTRFTPVFSQDQTYRLQSDRFGDFGLSYESWKAGEDRVTAFSIPMTIIYPAHDKLRFYAMTSPAFSNLKTYVDYNLGGMSDIKWGGHYLAFNDRWLITFGMNLPTGKSALETDEYSVASVLVLPAFNFRVPSLGQGFDAQVGLSTAGEMGSLVVGAGVSFLMKGGFKPFKNYDESYNPGDEITLSVGVDVGGVIGDILYTIYTDDTWGSEKVFRSGNRVVLQLLSSFQVGVFDVTVFIRDRLKGKNKTGSGDFYETERKNSNTNQFEIQSYWHRSAGRNARVKGILELKLYSNSEYGTGGATLLGVGGGWQFNLSPQLAFNSDLRYYFGKIQSASEKIDASGIKLLGGFLYTF